MPLRISGLASQMDTESMVQELMKAQSLKKTKLQNKITTLEWKQEKWDGINTKLYSFYTGPLSKASMESSFNTKKVSSSNEQKVEVTASPIAPEGNHSIQVKAIASSQFVTGSQLRPLSEGKEISLNTKLTDLGFDIKDRSTIIISSGDKKVEMEVDKDATIYEFISKCSDAGVNASYDTTHKRFFLSSKGSGYENAFSVSCRSNNVASVNNLSLLGLSEIKKTTNPDNSVSVTAGSNVSLVQPADSSIIYNGAEIKSPSNIITVNGLTVTLKELTQEDEVINISVSRDTQEVYDMVKNFVKSYNDVLKEMNAAYYADTARGYDPLTDEQKESMTDEQIKNWEDKIKSSLLRRDTTLSSITSNFTTTMVKSVEIGDKTYSLSSFGIEASEYSEKGLLHIKGDEEDPLSAGSENKLLKAINDNPEAVREVFNSLADELYSIMQEKMKGDGVLKSALTFYNDKEMKKSIDDYKKNLTDMEKKLSDMEERYYAQFTAMEKALSKLNNQASSLTSMLGGSAQS